jgi:hypothetical protein
MQPPPVGILTPLFGYSRAVIHGDIPLPRPDKMRSAPTTPWGQRIPKLFWVRTLLSTMSLVVAETFNSEE